MCDEISLAKITTKPRFDNEKCKFYHKLIPKAVKMKIPTWKQHEGNESLIWANVAQTRLGGEFWACDVIARKTYTGWGSEWNSLFRCTSRGWRKLLENWNNRKIEFHSTIPSRAQLLRARNGCVILSAKPSYVSYASQHTFSNVAVTIFEIYIYIIKRVVKG